MKWYKDAYNWFLIIITILVALPFIAPLLMQLGIYAPAKIIYFLYSFSCHQFHHRSLHIGEYQMAWCARDTAIWTSFAGVAWVNKFIKIDPIKFYWILPFTIAIALDGGIQTIATVFNLNNTTNVDGTCPFCVADNILPMYTSTNLVRFLTGAIFGTGLSLWISPTMREQSTRVLSSFSFRKYIDVNKYKFLTKNSFKQGFLAFMVPLVMLVGYLGMVQIWSSTNSKYPPTDFADFTVRTPNDDIFIRRKNGICPTDSLKNTDYRNPFNNLLALDCFLGNK